MIGDSKLNRKKGLPLVVLSLLVVSLIISFVALRVEGAPGVGLDFRKVAPQGFGDRQNTKAWSMIWWKENLYVGTARAHMCVEYAALADSVGGPFKYPPEDPDIECTPSPQDLPLQAEIWRYTPILRVWERVFQSPNDVEIPEHPGKFTARDAGFRGIVAFQDPDGTEALYIGGVTSEAINPGLPPPRILRSPNGRNWRPVPQDPGTVLGDLGRGQANFRAMGVYKKRLYVVTGDLRGGGPMLESADPAGGNDNFRFVTPEGMQVYEMAVYQGQLYVGLVTPGGDLQAGYAVAKTSATAIPPYAFTTVVDQGAYLEPLPSNTVVSMFVFKDALFVGTDKPAEMIRINPDDTWDLIVGTARTAPDGLKEPLSGMGAGFDYFLNEHIWRMGEHQQIMYVGTNDATGFIKEYAFGQPFLPLMGYDLFTTIDGVNYSMRTRTGFGDQLDIGIRVFSSTPVGLFFGTSNPFYGLFIQQSFESPTTSSLSPPTTARVENYNGLTLLSWEPVSTAVNYRVYRSEFLRAEELGVVTSEVDAWFPQEFDVWGSAREPFLVDSSAQADRIYHYYVVAQDANGVFSPASNLARSPSPLTAVTMRGLREVAARWTGGSGSLNQELAFAQVRLEQGDLPGSLTALTQIRAKVGLQRYPELPGWRSQDLDLWITRMIQRIRLAHRGLIIQSDLV